MTKMVENLMRKMAQRMTMMKKMMVKMVKRMKVIETKRVIRHEQFSSR